jgi:autotransporter-associated beta strand protein
LERVRHISLTRIALSSVMCLLLGDARLYADSAIWDLNPITGQWATPTNWTPDTVPNGPLDIATFGISNVTSVSVPAGFPGIEVNSMVFTPGASAYTITAQASAISAQLTISGAGIINNSGIVQNFVTMAAQPGSTIFFTNNATAGTLTTFTNDRTGSILFEDSSSAGSATFLNAAATNPLDGPAHIRFSGNSTAGDAVITNAGGVNPGTGGGQTGFFGNSTAGNAILIANSSSTPITGGGIIFFEDDSTGGTARVEVFGNGLLDISGHNSGVTIGSLEGSGGAFLGTRNLTVGSNNLTTTFSGAISDSGAALSRIEGIGGSLTKIGIGTLTLSGANTYTGPTTVNAGKLVVDGSITSPVTVNVGTLGGSGTTGSVLVNSGGIISPGNSAGILNVAGDLVLSLGAIYLVELNGTAVGINYDQISVAGAVSLNSATLSLSLGFAPNLGDAFTIIANDGTDSVSGTFDGLSEGEQFTADGGTFAISYRGGDGNDVALTSVVPEPSTWALLLLVGFVLAARSILSARRA